MRRMTIAVVLMLLLSVPVKAAETYKISRYTIDGGGGRSSSGAYVLEGTIGQPDTGWSIGGEYELFGGFLPGAAQKFCTGPHFDQWLAVGAPTCWCANINPRQCHSDADGKSQGNTKYWVSVNDLDILIGNWQVNNKSDPNYP